MPREARHALQRELVLRLRNFFRLKKRHRSLAELAHEELRLGNPGLALRIGRRALEQDANNPVLVALLAAALREDGSVEEAIGCAKRAVELRPADARSRERLGNVLLEAGSPQTAPPPLAERGRLPPRPPHAPLAPSPTAQGLGGPGEGRPPPPSPGR